MSSKTIAALFAFTLLLAQAANAATINVDFGNGAGGSEYAGVGAAPDAGTKWNNVSTFNATTAALANSQNTATAVTITTANITSNYDFGAGNDYSNTGAPNLVRDQFYTSPAVTGLVTINNLDPTMLYTLYLYEVRQNNTETTAFQVTDLNSTRPSQTSTPDNSGTSGFTLGEDYVVFSNLVPTAGNQLTISFIGIADPSFGAINGFQLVAIPVPEPCGLLLAGLGFAAVCRTTRRRRAC